ncbi:DUF3618 domain-containing protein [Sphingomonas sp. TX0543]|uniref:DUF3618 domain-containing protein n=1 Tax=Sphingomonas sp. TX0543 TaxID=3399682 RepID=UPI0010F8287A
MTDISELYRAEARAAEARARMNATLGALQVRLAPKNVAREAIGQISETGARAVEASVSAARRHPGKIAGGVALLAAALGHRHIGGALNFFRASLRKKPKRAVSVRLCKWVPRAERLVK